MMVEINIIKADHDFSRSLESFFLLVLEQSRQGWLA
jgi:hypothetical protein